jgi:hypothetical protein
MTWITCPECKYIGTVSSMNVVFEEELDELGHLVIADIWHGAERWVCPQCGWRANGK